jgi:hypothetical protein
MIRPVRKRMRDVLMDPGYSEEHLYVIVDENEKTSVLEWELDTETKAKIDRLIEYGMYRNVDEFLYDSLAHYLRYLYDYKSTVQ